MAGRREGREDRGASGRRPERASATERERLRGAAQDSRRRSGRSASQQAAAAAVGRTVDEDVALGARPLRHHVVARRVEGERHRGEAVCAPKGARRQGERGRASADKAGVRCTRRCAGRGAYAKPAAALSTRWPWPLLAHCIASRAGLRHGGAQSHHACSGRHTDWLAVHRPLCEWERVRTRSPGRGVAWRGVACRARAHP
jgi:hypothetical protein